MTEFSFVSTGMVKLLNFIVRKLAFLIGTFVLDTKHMRVLAEIWTSAVTLIMVVKASIPLMMF